MLDEQQILKEMSRVIKRGNGNAIVLLEKYNKLKKKARGDLRSELKNAIIILKHIIELQEKIGKEKDANKKSSLKGKLIFLSILAIIIIASVSANLKIQGDNIFVVEDIYAGGKVGINTSELIYPLNVGGGGNFTGEVYVESLVVENGTGSMSIGGKDFAVITATNISLPGGSRVVASINRDFGILTNFKGTVGLGVQNLNNNPNSSAAISALNDISVGVTMQKFSSTHNSKPNDAFIGNNVGNLMFVNRDVNGSIITISFFDDFIRDETLSVVEFVNQTKVIQINNSEASIPFLTTFFYPVDFINLTASLISATTVSANQVSADTINATQIYATNISASLIEADLVSSTITVSGLVNAGLLLVTGNAVVQGNFTANELYAFMNMTDNTEVTSIASSNVWYNVTGGFQLNKGNLFSQTAGENTSIVGLNGSYIVSWDSTYTCTANTQYELTVSVNSDPQLQCKGGASVGVPNERENTDGNCALSLVAGDKIGMMVRNLDSVANPTVRDAHIILRRVGD
jgi:hypothetical protein